MEKFIKPETSYCVEGVLDQVMENGAQTLYSNYLKPKIMPFSTKAVILTIMQPTRVSQYLLHIKLYSDLKSQT
jgi:hypothetical protein